MDDALLVDVDEALHDFAEQSPHPRHVLVQTRVYTGPQSALLTELHLNTVITRQHTQWSQLNSLATVLTLN